MLCFLYCCPYFTLWVNRHNPTVSPLYSHCTRTVPSLYPHCTPLYPHCTPTVPSLPPLYPYCTPTVSLLYPHCIPTVSPLYPHCIPTVPSLYPHCILTVSPLYLRKTGYCLHFLCLNHSYSPIPVSIDIKGSKKYVRSQKDRDVFRIRQPWNFIYISIQVVLLILLAIL